jgi:hypothetical protein
MAEIRQLLKALYGGKFTSATFSLLDPIPFLLSLLCGYLQDCRDKRKRKTFSNSILPVANLASPRVQPMRLLSGGWRMCAPRIRQLSPEFR